MKEPAVHLDRLEVYRMPGFPPTRAFEIDDLEPGINIIYGPNTSGKTTVAEAITLLLHGASPEEGRPSLRGRLTAQEQDYHVAFDGGARSFQKNGQPDPGPPLTAGSPDRYKVWLHELLAQADPNRDFAEQVLKASAGGYDLRAARSEEGLGLLESASTAGIKPSKAARAAERELREARRRTIDPTDVETKLERLRGELARAQDERTELGAIQQALEVRAYDDTLSTVVKRLEDLPSSLENMTGNEPATVRGLRGQIEDLTGDLRDAKRAIETAKNALKTAAVPEEDPPTDLVPTLRGRVHKLQQAESTITTSHRELQGARAEETELRETLGEVTDPEALGEIDTSHIQEAEELAEKADRLQTEQQIFAAVERWLGDGDQPTDTQAVEDGVRALRRWLQEPAEAQTARADSDAAKLARGASLLAILAGSGLGALGFLGAPGGLLTTVAGGVVLIIGLIVLVLTTRADQDSPSGARATYEREFTRTELDPPEAWDREAVEQRLEDLEGRLSEIHLHEERQRERNRLSPDEDDLKAAHDTLEEEATKLSERLGVKLELEERTFLWFVRNLANWQAARAKANGAEEGLDTAKDQRKTLVDGLQEALEPYGYGRPEDGDHAHAWVEDLGQRFQDVREANRDLEQAREDEEDAQTELEETREELATIFTNLDLEPGDDAGLQRLVEQLDTYKDAVKTRDEVRPVRDNALEVLQEHPGYEAGMEKLPVPGLQDREAALEAALEPKGEDPEPETDRVDELNTKIGRLEERIENAKKAHAVEEALQDLDEAVNALHDKMEEETEKVIGWMVAEHVHQRTRHEDRPPVFHRAAGLLRKITLGRYELDFDDGDPPAFRAIDTRYDEVKTLDQLSSGTRIQLLLAIRLAFLEQQEDGSKLPLLLDETLATTDDIRAPAIIQAVIQIAREGRQVFYLTAQRDEVGKWSTALQDGGQPMPTYRIIDLAEQRTLNEELGAPKVEISPPPVREIPPREDRDHDAYGQLLGVPAFNPAEDVGATHLWYLVEDTGLLHSLLELGIDRWGQLSSLKQGTSDLDSVLDDPTWSKLQAKAKALKAFQAAWWVGRGKPVDRAVLDEAPGVTPRKIDEVATLAEELGGDPEALLEALSRGEVPNFLSKQHDKLEAFLSAEGYLDTRSRLSSEMVQQRTLVSVAEEIDQGLLDREEVLMLLQRWTVGR